MVFICRMSPTVTSYQSGISLDQETLENLSLLADKWNISNSEVISRVVKKTKDEEIPEPAKMTPSEALRWFRTNGISREEAEAWKEEIRLEREAKRYWRDDRPA